jgi:hypothetical protein
LNSLPLPYQGSALPMSYGGVPGRVADALEPYDDSRSGTARETHDGPDQRCDDVA